MMELQNVGKSYENGKVIALQDINLSIKKGSIYCVIGRNGAGKSTLFKIICKVIKSDTGKCIIKNENNRIDQISYLPETRGLDTRQITLEHITNLLCYKGLKKKVAQEKVTYWLKEFGIYDYRHRRINTLSKGNQQKLQFISAIANDPEILILDEPFSGLDSITTDFFWDVLMRFKAKGCIILFSTHNLSDKLLLSDYFTFLVKGKLVEKGTLDEIQERYDMVLEIRNDSLDEKKIYTIVDKEKVEKVGNVYYINVENKVVAREIFNTLENPFSERFYLRKTNITELFRLFNRGNDNEYKNN